MRVVIKEHIWLVKEEVGMPFGLYYTVTLGAHRQKQYDLQGRISRDDGRKEPGEEDLTVMRNHAIAAMRRTKEIRKAEKRLPMEIVVERAQ